MDTLKQAQHQLFKELLLEDQEHLKNALFMIDEHCDDQHIPQAIEELDQILLVPTTLRDVILYHDYAGNTNTSDPSSLAGVDLLHERVNRSNIQEIETTILAFLAEVYDLDQISTFIDFQKAILEKSPEFKEKLANVYLKSLPLEYQPYANVTFNKGEATITLTFNEEKWNRLKEIASNFNLLKDSFECIGYLPYRILLHIYQASASSSKIEIDKIYNIDDYEDWLEFKSTLGCIATIYGQFMISTILKHRAKSIVITNQLGLSDDGFCETFEDLALDHISYKLIIKVDRGEAHD